jgi:hypothetical protein
MMAGGVDHLRGFVTLEIHAESGDLLAGYSDVTRERARRRDDVAALDDLVEWHRSFPL